LVAVLPAVLGNVDRTCPKRCVLPLERVVGFVLTSLFLEVFLLLDRAAAGMRRGAITSSAIEH
jgi:hypothetical protein